MALYINLLMIEVVTTLRNALAYIYRTTINSQGRFTFKRFAFNRFATKLFFVMVSPWPIERRRRLNAFVKAAMGGALQTTREQGEHQGFARDARSIPALVKQEGKKGHQLGSSTTSVGQSRIEY